MAHHQYDPTRLRRLTQGPDTGQPRLWDYESNVDEDEFIEKASFWNGSGMRTGAWVQIYGAGKLAEPVPNILTLTSQGLAQSGLDVYLDRIARTPAPLPDVEEAVRAAMCNLLQCGG